MTADDVRQTLELWLRYDEGRRTLTARMFAERESSESVQRLLDDNEVLRNQAVTLTHKILQQLSTPAP